MEMDDFTQLVQSVNGLLWGMYCLIPLLVGTGIYLTIKLRFIQIRRFGQAFRKVFGGITLFGDKAGKDGMSSFQSLATAISAQVGTGNLAGVATAIAMGGPGAIFWMWLAAFFGMATIFAEATLAQVFRARDAHGQIMGGPAFYISRGLHNKPLAAFFAVSIIIALGFIGNMVQANSIADGFHKAFEIPQWATGIFVFAIAGFIFIGGVQRLASVTEKIVPIMAAVFLAGGLIVLIARIKYVPATFGMIFRYAFAPQAIIGGGFGYALKTAISQGAKRGLFSNEAGMGSTPHAHAQANVAHAHDQGVVAMIGVFIDTFIVLTLNALVIICTLYTADGPLANGYFGDITATLGKTNLAQTAFGSVFGASLGAKFVAICLLFFAFSTILSWNLFGKINANYLFGKKNSKLCSAIYTVIALVFIFLGTVSGSDFVWEVTDMFNNLIVLPNVIALFALTGMVVASMNEMKKDKLKV